MSATTEYQPDGMLVLDSPAPRPAVLDMLIVGGGPAGTAAAFHAKELGLSPLVIDYDDLMKRIRDYPKEKLILPDFGGGDQMKFPRGRKLISLLHFQPIEKDEMCTAWKGFYRRNSVPAQAGVELLGMERRKDGTWDVKTWNHNVKAELIYTARHVVLAIGRGVPRRFDIPGNTDGIAYRLADAKAYVGAPALVMGGGTSAAEAVIAISNAKAKESDPSAVYWSYRGDKLPKVSKALAEVFFDAYMGNGNIRYFPNSEPVAVVTADDRKDYLSLRTDRRCIAGRPNETAHMEFPKEFCIACIGEDIPEALLNSLGVFLATGGPGNKKRMVVSPILETQQRNLYLIGDILSQAYLEADNFGGDPAEFREIKHRGNIKAAMRDGVLVAEVVAQKIAGKKEIEVNLDFEEEAPAAAAPVAVGKALSVVTIIMEQAAEPRKEARGSSEEPRAYLIKRLAGSVEEDEFAVNRNGVTTLGRKFCDIVFPDDEMLSERQASILHGPDGYFVRDDASSTGVFFKAREGKPVEVSAGDLVRAGRQFLLFRGENGRTTAIHFDQSGEEINRYPLSEKTIVAGREAPDITLDSKDMTLSRRHLSISVKGGSIWIKDLKSVNGTYIKVRDTIRLEDGDEFRLGRQFLKFSLSKEIAPQKIHVSTKQPGPPTRETPPPPKEEAPAAGAAPAGMVIRFKNTGAEFLFTKGQTICEIAEKNSINIVAECHAGMCGIDPVRIISGRENLNPVGSDEKEALEDICGLTPGECRLACVAKPAGPLEVEIIKK